MFLFENPSGARVFIKAPFVRLFGLEVIHMVDLVLEVVRDHFQDDIDDSNDGRGNRHDPSEGGDLEVILDHEIEHGNAYDDLDHKESLHEFLHEDVLVIQ